MNIRHMELFACPAARIPTVPCWQNAIVMTASTAQVIYSEITAFFSPLHPPKYIGHVLAFQGGAAIPREGNFPPVLHQKAVLVQAFYIIHVDNKVSVTPQERVAAQGFLQRGKGLAHNDFALNGVQHGLVPIDLDILCLLYTSRCV